MLRHTVTVAVGRAPSRWQKLGAGPLALLGAATAIGPLTIDLYLPAFPDMAEEFGVTPAGVQLSLTAAVVGVALGQLIVGPMSDRLGRRWPLVVGLFAFVVLSLACAAAPTLEALIAARAGQGFLAGAGIVVCRAVLRDYTSGAALGRALAGLFLVVGAGPILAPSLGSLLLGVTGWRGVFVALAVFGLLIAVAVTIWMPESLPRDERRRVPVQGLLRIYGELFRDRSFIAPTLATSATFAALFAYISAGSFVLQESYNLSQFGYGLVFGVISSCIILGSQISPRLIERVGVLPVLRHGTTAGFSVVVVLTIAAVMGWASLPVLVGLLMALFLTIGLTLPAGATLALSTQPPSRAGQASGLIGVLQFVVAGLAAPIVGLVDASSATVMAVVMTLAMAAAVMLARATRESRESVAA